MVRASLAQSRAHLGHHSAVRGGLAHKLPGQTPQDQTPVLPLALISYVTPNFTSLVPSPLHVLNVNDSYDNYSRVIL